MNSAGEGRRTCAEVTTIYSAPLIGRGDMEERAQIVNVTLAGVRVVHFHSVGGGEVHAPITWMVL